MMRGEAAGMRYAVSRGAGGGTSKEEFGRFRWPWLARIWKLGLLKGWRCDTLQSVLVGSVHHLHGRGLCNCL